MTTQVKISTNGAYVASGTLTITGADGVSAAPQEVSVSGVGSSGPVEKVFHVPHGSNFSLHISEREATDEEKAAGKVE